MTIEKVEGETIRKPHCAVVLIRQCEAAIIKAEESLAKEEKLLEEASQAGNAKAIHKHSESIAKHQDQIEALFIELEQLNTDSI